MTKTNILVVVLTILSYWSILNVVRRKTKKSFSMVIGSQTDIHNMTKIFFEKKTTKQKTSQMQQYEEKNRIDVLVIDDEAYWISNNVFYRGEIVDGQIDHDTTKPVDTQNMKQTEIDKMLFIIDSLKNGNKNDFGGTRN
jgi:hypothetical protein